MKIAILSRNKKLYSTKSLEQAALDRGHEVIIVDYTKCFVVMEKGKPSVYFKGKNLDDIDAIIPRIGASFTMFGTSIVRQFEMRRTLTSATAQSIEQARDKLKSLQIFSMFNIGIPKTAFAKFPKKKDIDSLIKQVGGAPLVIKLLEGTQGLGVVLAESKRAAKSVIESFSSLKANILVQEYIKEAKGSDLRAIVVNGEVVAAMKRTSKSGEFRSNLHQGGSAQMVALNRKERSTAIKAAKAMGLAFAGVDMLQSKRGPLIMEVNASPGLEGIENTTGIDVASEVIGYLEDQFEKRKLRKSKKRIQSHYDEYEDAINLIETAKIQKLINYELH